MEEAGDQIESEDVIKSLQDSIDQIDNAPSTAEETSVKVAAAKADHKAAKIEAQVAKKELKKAKEETKKAEDVHKKAHAESKEAEIKAA